MIVSPERNMPTNRVAGRCYRAPEQVGGISLQGLLRSTSRGPPTPGQHQRLSTDLANFERADVEMFFAGDIDVLSRTCVAIVGARQASQDGLARAARLARELVAAGITIVSGLARGIDTAAHVSAISHGGRTAAVIATPLSKAYPAENAELQEQIWREYLLLSPFRDGGPLYRGHFPIRNRVMAAVSDATVIIEASDTSGTLHQAAECRRLGRWLFIARSVVDDASLRWPQRFVGKPKVGILTTTADVVNTIQTAGS